MNAEVGRTPPKDDYYSRVLKRLGTDLEGLDGDIDELLAGEPGLSDVQDFLDSSTEHLEGEELHQARVFVSTRISAMKMRSKKRQP